MIIPPSRRPRTTPRRLAALFAGLALVLGILAGCSSQGADTDCGLDACTVTFERGVEANASVLGIDAKLVGAEGDRVTVEVAGERLQLTMGQQATEVGGLGVSLESVTDSEVKVRIAHNGGE